MDDINAFHGDLAISNPVWAQLDMESFQLLPGVHIPKHFAARLPVGAIPVQSVATSSPNSPPRGSTAATAATQPAVRMCRDDPNCTRDDCYFAHTNKAPYSGRCAYGERCTKNGCTLSHDANDTISPPLKAAPSTLSANAPVFELDDSSLSSFADESYSTTPTASSYGGRLPRSSKHHTYDSDAIATSGTGAGVNGWWSQQSTSRRTSPPSTPSSTSSRSPTRSTSPTNGLATIPRPVNMTPMRRVNHNIHSTAPTQSGRADTANAWTSVRRHRHSNSNGNGHSYNSPSRSSHSSSSSRGNGSHWHQSHSNSMVSVSA